MFPTVFDGVLAKQTHRSGAPPVRRGKATNPEHLRFGEAKPPTRSTCGLAKQSQSSRLGAVLEFWQNETPQETDAKSKCCAHQLFGVPVTTHPWLGQNVDSIDGTGVDG
jgi:hypothetical protein